MTRIIGHIMHISQYLLGMEHCSSTFCSFFIDAQMVPGSTEKKSAIQTSRALCRNYLMIVPLLLKVEITHRWTQLTTVQRKQSPNDK